MGAVRDARPRAGRRALSAPITAHGALGFALGERQGDPSELVVPPAVSGERRAYLVRPDRRALVLGSAQPEGAADGQACAAAGVVVVRRRSGGGAVLVGPGEQIWLDAFVPFDDPLFEPDVSRAAWWLGEVWASALAAAGLGGAIVHRDRLFPGALGRIACFAGVGPGEVLLGGRKVVGISQRRDRRGAWLFSMARSTPPAGPLGLEALLDLPAAGRAALAAQLAGTTTALSAPPRLVEAALAAKLA